MRSTQCVDKHHRTTHTQGHTHWCRQINSTDCRGRVQLLSSQQHQLTFTQLPDLPCVAKSLWTHGHCENMEHINVFIMSQNSGLDYFLILRKFSLSAVGLYQAHDQRACISYVHTDFLLDRVQACKITCPRTASQLYCLTSGWIQFNSQVTECHQLFDYVSLLVCLAKPHFMSASFPDSSFSRCDAVRL